MSAVVNEERDEQPGRGSTTTPEAKSQWGFRAVPADLAGTMLRCSTRKGAVQGVSDPIAPPRSPWDEALGNESRGAPARIAAPDCSTENSCQKCKVKGQKIHHTQCLDLMNLIVPRRILIRGRSLPIYSAEASCRVEDSCPFKRRCWPKKGAGLVT